MNRLNSRLTLIELIVTILILVGLSSVLIPLFGNTVKETRSRASQVSLYKIRDAVMGTAETPGYFQDIGSLPTDLGDLYVVPSSLSANLQSYDPVTKTGWRGPYLESINAGRYEADNDYGQLDDLFPVDASRNAIVLQIPTSGADAAENQLNARLVAPGPNGVIDCPQNLLTPADLTAASRVDDEVLFLQVFDVNGGTN